MEIEACMMQLLFKDTDPWNVTMANLDSNNPDWIIINNFRNNPTNESFQDAVGALKNMGEVYSKPDHVYDWEEFQKMNGYKMLKNALNQQINIKTQINMKRIILAIVFMSVAIGMNAQKPDHYAGKNTMCVQGVIYQVSDKGDFYFFERSTNVLTSQRYELYAAIPINWQESMDKATKEVFSIDEIKRFQDQEIRIGLYINARTGNIDELRFAFDKDTPMQSIAPERYYLLELKIKEYQKFRNPEPHSDRQIIKMSMGIRFRDVKIE